MIKRCSYVFLYADCRFSLAGGLLQRWIIEPVLTLEHIVQLTKIKWHSIYCRSIFHTTDTFKLAITCLHESDLKFGAIHLRINPPYSGVRSKKSERTQFKNFYIPVVKIRNWQDCAAQALSVLTVLTYFIDIKYWLLCVVLCCHIIYDMEPEHKACTLT